LDRTVFGSFNEFERLPSDSYVRILQGDGAKLDRWDVVAGHFALPTLRESYDLTEIFCLLREPRARLLSHFWYWLSFSEQQHRIWEPYAASQVPQSQGWYGFLTDPSIAASTDNIVLRLLLAGHSDIPVDGFIDHSCLMNLAERAISVVDEMGYVGVTDCDSDFWTPLTTFLACPLVPTHVNETDGGMLTYRWSDAFSSDSIRALDMRTAGDSEVWRHVARRTFPSESIMMVSDASFCTQLVKVAAGNRADGRHVLTGRRAWTGLAMSRSVAAFVSSVARRIPALARNQEGQRC
jgi:hypothetical protein